MRTLFIGGCLLISKSIEKKKRFYGILPSKIPALKISLEQYSSYSLLNEIIDAQIISDKPDAIILFIRPFPFFALNKPFPKIAQADGVTKIKIHPALFMRKKQKWFSDDKFIVETYSNPRGTKRTLWHKLNLSLGLLLGLNNWACVYVKNKIATLCDVCKQKNIRLIVVGPPNISNDVLEKKSLQKLNSELLNYFSSKDFCHLNLFDEKIFQKNIFDADKLHFNELGHSLLAEKLFQIINSFMPEVKEKNFISHKLIYDILLS